jgi:peroxiredoxin
MFFQKKLVITNLCILLSIGVIAQGYEIPVKVNNLTDSMIYLGHHFGNGYFINDSTKLDKSGQAVFKGEKPLKGGIYFLLLSQNKYFDFLIDKHQTFSIICDTSNFLTTVKFKNSFQNTKFFAYQRYLSQRYNEINVRRELQKQYITKLDTLMMIEEDIELIQNKIYLQKEEIIAAHPDSLLSVIIKASLPIVPPPAPRDTSGAMIDSSFEYHYVKKHFFDNINFADDRLLQTTLLQNKVFEYLSKMAVPHYDSISAEVDYIVNKSAANADVYKFVLNSLFQYYVKSNLLTDENVFVYIAQNYYLNGKTPWSTPDFTSKLKTDIDSRKPSLIGQIAPDFQMKDDKGKLIRLRAIQNKYVILYFYDVECEICEQVSPELMNFYRIIKDRGVDVIAVYVGKDKAKWAKYIEEKHLIVKNLMDADNKSGYREKYKIAGTPLIYLLDEDQKIVAKRINVDQLMGYFNSLN